MRRILALILGGVLVAAAVSALTPAWTDRVAAQQTSPVVRIQLVIERIHVLDDSDDLTSGELTYRFRLQRGSSNCSGLWCTGPGELFIDSVSISADTGDVRTVGRVLGGSSGMALFMGNLMQISFAGVEEDWDGPGIAFCPVRSATQFDDSLCGAHDKLGIYHLTYSHPPHDASGALESLTVRDRSGDATFRVDYRVRRVSTTASLTGPTPTPNPYPTPLPTAQPGHPPRHEP